MKEIIIGIVSICFGVVCIYVSYKYPTKGNDVFLADFGGYLGGIAGIVIGILFLIGVAKWQ
jgi:hypothetical protein